MFVSDVRYMDGRLGFVDEEDMAWIMDDYGNLMRVPFSLPSWFWQEA
jgi:hypothetical protein